VLFLDEPTAGVDPINRRRFWELIYRMAQEGVTILVTTHYMDEAELCQRVGFLSQGRLIVLDSPDRLKQTEMRGHVLEIDCSSTEVAMPVLREAQTRGEIPMEDVSLYGAQIHLVVPEAESARGPVHALLERNGVQVTRISWIAPTLEDVFISAVKPLTGADSLE
jgi:ABC-2 type transport system ATP-binding protein